MGAWGIGVFENDDALDWVVSFVEENDKDQLQEILYEALEMEYVEEPVGSSVLGAAEVVAALNGNPSEQLPEELVEWLKSNQGLTEELIQLAKKSVIKVQTESEIKELWEKSSDFNLWTKMVDNLLARLATR